MDSTNPYTPSVGYMDLLTSQCGGNTLDPNFYETLTPNSELPSSEVPLFSTQGTDAPIQGGQPAVEKKERRAWSTKEDLILISAWLNTSKDPVVSNEQKKRAFWTRISLYYNSAVVQAGYEERPEGHSKQRWQKINDEVNKFVGCLEAANNQRSSGQNDNDVMKLAYEFYYNDRNKKFTLEHCWRELRHDQKWCLSRKIKGGQTSKRKKVDVSGQESSNLPLNLEDDESIDRPAGVKAAKSKSKRPMAKTVGVDEEDKSLQELKNMLTLKRELTRSKLLDSLVCKTEPLSESEIALKDKLIAELLS